MRDQIVKKNKCGTTGRVERTLPKTCAGLRVERKSPEVAGKAV